MTAPLQLAGDRNVVTLGQLDAKPIDDNARSSTPSQRALGPPHALQMAFCFFVSAALIRRIAWSSPTGQGFVWLPVSRPSQHCCNAFERSVRYLAVALPIARWQRLTSLLVPNSAGSKAP